MMFRKILRIMVCDICRMDFAYEILSQKSLDFFLKLIFFYAMHVAYHAYSMKGKDMPQVAARISDNQERWLKDYFRTKSAGAEFILPWAVDTFFRAIGGIRAIFTEEELKTIVEAHKDTKLMPDHTRLTYLIVRVMDICDINGVHKKYGASRTSLETKLKQLDDTQATALMIWAVAFWVSKNCSSESLDEYVRS